ncbi:MAG: serine hydrolase domain-containing protein, partial [Bacteroidota bacterium]
MEDVTKQMMHLQLDSFLLDEEIKSYSAGVIYKGETYTFHDGKLLNGKSPDDSTLYEMASLTKTFTGTLLAEAIAENKIKLEDDIRNYLDGSFPNLQYKNQPILVKHLVLHESGLPRMLPNRPALFENPDFNTLPNKINALQSGYTKSNFMNDLTEVQIDTFPGSVFNYSNTGANLLGYILENLYGQDYETILKGKIFQPLKMNNSIIDRKNNDLSKLADGQNIEGFRMPFMVNKGISAEGGIISNTKDMLAYCAYHLAEDKSEVIQIAHQHLWGGKYGDFESAFFWQVNKRGEAPDLYFQNGGAFGTSSWITLIPEEDFAIFLVTDVSGPQIHQKMNQSVEKLIEKILDR